MLTDCSRIATSGNTTFTRNTAEGDGGETGGKKSAVLPLLDVALNEGDEGLVRRSMRAARVGHILFGWRARDPETTQHRRNLFCTFTKKTGCMRSSFGGLVFFFCEISRAPEVRSLRTLC